MNTSSRTQDVIVVGGGIIGLSIAHNLALHEAVRSVTLIERRQLGGSMVPNSIASVEPFSLFLPVALLQSYSIGVYTGSRDDTRLDLGYTLAPMTLLVGEDDLPVLRKIITVCKAAGSHIAELNLDEITQRFPEADLSGVVAAAYSEDSGTINPARAIRQYVNALRRHRVKLLEGVQVQALLRTGGRVTGVQTSEGDYEADAVVLATGGWTGRFLERLGLPNPLVERVHLMGSVEMPSSPEMGAEENRRFFSYSVRDMQAALYVYPGGGGRYMFGSHRWADTQPIADLDGFNGLQQTEVLDLAYARLQGRFPMFKEATRREHWSILWDVSPDKQPLMGAVPGLEGLFMAAGTSGMGYKLAPAIGASIASIITGDEAVIKLFAALQPRRVADNQLLIPQQNFGIQSQS